MASDNPIVVIGGGIAGASAILALGQLGLEPVWVTPQTPPGDRVGESLAPAAHRTLKALNVEDVVNAGAHRRSNATFSAWGQDQLVERNAISQINGSGWVLNRGQFEADLVERATHTATPVATTLQSFQREGERWALALNNGETLDASFLFDATGRSASIGRQFATLKRTDQLVAAWGVLEQTEALVEPTRATLIEAVDDGWWYAALLPDSRLAVAWFTDPDLVPANLTRDLSVWTRKLTGSRYVQKWIDDADFAPIAPPTLASAGTTWLDPCAGDGWAAIGDAAAAFDPLSSHGMTTALWSGHAAVQALASQQNGNTDAIAEYATMVSKGVESFLTQRARFYGSEKRFQGAPFWDRRQSKAAA